MFEFEASVIVPKTMRFASSDVTCADGSPSRTSETFVSGVKRPSL